MDEINATTSKKWEQDGYLVLEGFFSREDLEAYEDEWASILNNRSTQAGQITVDALEGELRGRRMRLKDAPDEVISNCAHKVNDLYLESKSCRNLNLNPKLSALLDRLLGGSPIVINSLSFRKGSQQGSHFDYYYMPPPVDGKMVVTSICLEDQSEDSGPLFYYPGSHNIPPYAFTSKDFSTVQAEMENATAYVAEEIQKRGLQQQSFVGKAGDVFIWHGQLYHGGLPIQDHNLTRKTLVTHYWRKMDVPGEMVAETGEDGFYLRRDHQSVG